MSHTVSAVANSKAAIWQRDDVARSYLTGTRRVIPLANEQFTTMLRVMETFGTQVERFLDLGAGAGAVAAVMLEKYPNALATLVDFSPPMLEEAKARFADRASQVTVVEADLSSRAWLNRLGGQGEFDAVVSGYAIHHLPHDRKRDLYGEVFSLLRPGGMFFNVEHVESASPALATAFDQLMIDSLLAAQSADATEQERESVISAYHKRMDKEVNILAPVELQCEWLREIGFSDVDCIFKVLELAVFGGRKPQPRTA